MSGIRLRGDFVGTEPSHAVVHVTIDGQQFGTFCGDSWCQGTCGNPALRITATDCVGRSSDLKLHGEMVACGAAFQRFRVQWDGDFVDLPVHLHERARKLLWL